MKARTDIWKPIEYPGMEYLTLHEEDQSIQVESVVIGVEDQSAFRLDYAIRCDAGYVVQDVQLSLLGGKLLHLTHDGQGNWFDEGRELMPNLKGCTDIDISATPFTNTLPIKRLTWTVGQSELFHMAWFSIPEMTVHNDAQRYTCVEQTASGAIFRFEQVSSGFTALLSVDADGLVVNYPGLFERIWAG